MNVKKVLMVLISLAVICSFAGAVSANDTIVGGDGQTNAEGDIMDESGEVIVMPDDNTDYTKEELGDGKDSTLKLNTTDVESTFTLSIPPTIPMDWDETSGNYIAKAYISLSNIIVNVNAPKDLVVNVTSGNGFNLQEVDSDTKYPYTLVTKSFETNAEEKTSDDNSNTLEDILKFESGKRLEYPENTKFRTDMTFTYVAHGIQLAGLDVQDTLTFKVAEVDPESI